VSSEMQPEEIAYFLQHGEATLVVAVPEAIERVAQALQLIDDPPALVDCSKFGQQLAPARQQANGEQPNALTECALLYTSGSTGKPKGCILNNEYFISCGEWYTSLGGLAELRWGEERLLTPLPLGHMNAMACSTVAMIISAGCIIQLDRFHPGTWWKTVRDSGASVVHYLGVLPAILLELPAADDDFSAQIRFGFGAGVNPKHHARFEERFGFPLIEAWAMTESGCAGCIIANHEPRHVGTSCFGQPDAGVEYQLVDECKQEVARGEDGELRVRAAGENPRRGFFSGYLKNPEATAQAWQDGWLNTGDVVRESEDGTLQFVDRRKNVIRRSGENISALEVEAALSLDPAIGEALVTAVPDELRGDEVAACIVVANGVATDKQLATDILDRCMQNLAYFKSPGYVIFCDDLPKTASNKPRRGDIKTLARSHVAAGDCIDLRHLKKRQRAD